MRLLLYAQFFYDIMKQEDVMAFSFTHVNFNVLDLQRSMRFYEEAFGLREKRRLELPDFTLV